MPPSYACSLGMKRFPAGRMGDSPARDLSESLAKAGFKLGRLQTGTPARLDARTVNVKDMEVQGGDADPSPFSFLNTTVANKVRRGMYVRMGGSINPTEDNQVACYRTHTTPETHRLIRESMHLSVHIQETKKGRLFFFFSCAKIYLGRRPTLLSLPRSKGSALCPRASYCLAGA